MNGDTALVYMSHGRGYSRNPIKIQEGKIQEGGVLLAKSHNNHYQTLMTKTTTQKNPTQKNPTAAMIVIGDEILSGRTRDANMYHLAGVLGQVGIILNQVRVIGDDKTAIITAVRELCQTHTHVFTSGGIGPTHDDITAECVAEAFNHKITIRKDARAILASHYKGGEADLTPARLRMARIPDGAVLIKNTISGAPGFSIENLHVLAGVPHIFADMVANLLPTLPSGARVRSDSVRVDLPESTLALPLARIASDHPDITIGSYPFYENGRHGAHLVVRGIDSVQIKSAIAAIKTQFLTAP